MKTVSYGTLEEKRKRKTIQETSSTGLD